MKVLDRFKSHKMPDSSVFYDRVIPALFLAFGVVTAGLIIFAIGVFTGLIDWV